jgi:hypothetical protein
MKVALTDVEHMIFVRVGGNPFKVGTPAHGRYQLITGGECVKDWIGACVTEMNAVDDEIVDSIRFHCVTNLVFLINAGHISLSGERKTLQSFKETR